MHPDRGAEAQPFSSAASFCLRAAGGGSSSCLQPLPLCTDVLDLAARLRLDPTRHDVMTGECRPEKELSFSITCALHPFQEQK